MTFDTRWLFEALFAVGALVAAGAVLKRWKLYAPPRDALGVRLVDAEDSLGTWALDWFKVAVFCAVSAVPAFVLWSYYTRHPFDWHALRPEHLLLGVFLAVFLSAGPYAIGWQLWRLCKLLVYAPGELHSETWPLVGGEEAVVRYSRRVRRAAGLLALDAVLVCYERQTRGSGKSASIVEVSVYRQALGNGNARLEFDTVTADFRFKVPPPPPTVRPGDPVRAALNLGWLVPQRFSWRIEVIARLDGLPAEDSRFEVLITPGVTGTRAYGDTALLG